MKPPFGKNSQMSELMFEIFDLGFEIKMIMEKKMIKEKLMAKHYSLTGNELRLMVFLSRQSEMQVNELAEMIGLSSSTIVIRLNSLEDKDLIIRERNKSDRRKVYIHLSAKGRLIIKEINVTPPIHLVTQIMTLSDADKLHFTRILKHINKSGNLSEEELKERSHNRLQKLLGFV